jgi:ring-1,2-phenylacetyl-CoA epoxidase subunit PaaE
VTSTFSPASSAGVAFHRLIVDSAHPLTDDAVCLGFRVPESVTSTFTFTAGQHVIVRRAGAGGEVRRTYSICSSPNSGELQIGVRRIEGGALSTWLTEEVRIGDAIEVSAPIGKFGSELSDPLTRNIGLVAIGSGITPLLSLARTHLESTPDSTVTLVFGNRTNASTMFAEAVAALKDTYMSRFHVVHVLTRESRGIELLNGRIDSEHMSALLDMLLPHREVDHWFLCGPIEAVLGAQDALEASGVDTDLIHRELFYAEPTRRSPHVATSGTTVEVVLNGRTTVLYEEDLSGSILDGVMAQRTDAPFSCRNGVCGTCKARCVSGEVAMDSTWALDDAEIRDGVLLTCQATPVSENVRVEFL